LLFILSGMNTNWAFTGKLAVIWIIGAVTLASANNAKALSFALPVIHVAMGDQRELGQVHPAISQGDAAITQYVNSMIGLSLGGSGHVSSGPHDNLVTRSMNNFGALPSAAALALRGKGTIDLGTQVTYDYLFAHYGGPRGGFAEVWYVGDLSGSGLITIPGNALRHGLSGGALFTNAGGRTVPDGGTTAMLLGVALGALGVVRRYLL
jgi:VPDSG-CTERM motif